MKEMRMKRLLAILGLASLMLLPLQAFGAYIDDNYWGAPDDVYGSVDYIGTEYDITGMDVNLTGSHLEVKIYSPTYFNTWVNTDWQEFYGTNVPVEYGPGDLFLSTDGWSPHKSQDDKPYLEDNYTTGEDWEFVIKLENILSTTNRTVFPAGEANLYKVSDDAEYVDPNISAPSGTKSTILGGTIKTDQEVSYLPVDQKSLQKGFWEFVDSDANSEFDTLLISMMLSDEVMSKLGSDTLGMHWTMECGNDIIEGGYSPEPVPEPATMVLFGAGLMGIAALSRRRS